MLEGEAEKKGDIHTHTHTEGKTEGAPGWPPARGRDPECVGEPPGWTLSLCPSHLRPATTAASTKVTPHPCPAQTPQRAGSRSHKQAEKEAGEALGWDPQVIPFLGQMRGRGSLCPPTPLLGWTP